MRLAVFSLVLLAACGGSKAPKGGASSGSTGSTGRAISGGGSGGISTSAGASSSSGSGTSGTTSSGASTTSGATTTSSGSSSGSSGSTGAQLAALGDSCVADADCASGMCRSALLGGGFVCVSDCRGQSDCTSAGTGFYCAPLPGDAGAWCVPPSAAHCAGCTTDADCGELSDACATPPGDTGSACLVDCSISGASACPLDYTCTSMTVNGASRSLCTPNVGSCGSAQGGDCTRVAGPLACSRTNADGTCTGKRTCDTGTGRFGTCNATTPACRASCTAPFDPACTVDLCAGVLDQPASCGSCTTPCPGWNQATAVVTCDATHTCTFACAGPNYDSNSNELDGCEAPDPVDDHDGSTPTELGNSTCHDGDGIPGTPAGTIASDAQVHTPAINGFVTSVGAAPDYFHTFNTGGTCYDDFSITLTVSGSAYPTCYKLTVQTSNGTWQANTDGSGTANVSSGSGSYSDNSDIYLVAEKTCSTAQVETVTYAISGHF